MKMNKKKILSFLDPRFFNGIAHRGLHNNEYTENGKKAFLNAINHDVAFEFDIHLSKDNELIVCHDEDLYRTTNKHGIIEQLTLKQIKENYTLIDGGEILTLEEVLELNNFRVPVVIELKVYEKNYKELSKRVIKSLKQIKDKSKVMIISFDPRSLWPLKGYGFIRSLLVAQSHFYTYMFKRSVESIDVEHVLLDKKSVRNYHKRHFVNVWTIDNEDLLNKVIPYVDTVTYQHIDPNIVKNTLKK